MSSVSRVLYVGVTNSIERRVAEHKAKSAPGFSARYNTYALVYFEPFGNIRAAIAREKQIKGWLRAKKVVLIRSSNPQWKDLSAPWPKPTQNSRPAQQPSF
jgi:putative endonuclease